MQAVFGLLAGLAAPPVGDRLIGACLATTGRRGMSGGDPKLSAAIGAGLGWLAPSLVPPLPGRP